MNKADLNAQLRVLSLEALCYGWVDSLLRRIDEDESLSLLAEGKELGLK